MDLSDRDGAKRALLVTRTPRPVAARERDEFIWRDRRGHPCSARFVLASS